MAMAKPRALLSYYLLAVFISVTTSPIKATDHHQDRKVHIVYMGALPHDGAYSPSSHHFSILQSVVHDIPAADSLILSYKRSFNGFAANITDGERQKIAGLREVVSVFPSEVLHTQTTRSWDFMGFPQSVTRNPTVESDTIIGVIDTGIWPESESFSDEGFGPPPKKWKGVCAGGINFTCNNKIIGARFYNSYNSSDATSARDDVGHGTHTASTAAGNVVKQASFYGIAEGIARGAVPSARIAAYKVCSFDGCYGHYILAGFDDAIADGVDLITASFGHIIPVAFHHDPVSIASFHAMRRGILTLNAAGNDGPSLKRVTSVAPWLMTVAASKVDRRIIDKVVLGNGVTMIGNSVNSFVLNGTTFPLIHGKNASRRCVDWKASSCDVGCLETDLVKGKIVACDSTFGHIEANRAGAVGTVVLNQLGGDTSFVFPHAVSALTSIDYGALNHYLDSTDNPLATILKSEAVKVSEAPMVASFSSRGPNKIAPDILKPDIIAPGIEILAAFSLSASPSGSVDDTRRVKYNIESGTSMSCPHVAGAAAYVKSFHPDWSASAVKSSLMTTASAMKNTKESNGEFGYGSGHVNPIKAINPGLVYEAYEEDYVRFLCSAGYNEEKLRLISGDKNSSCPAGPEKGSPGDLNYPSMCARVSENKVFLARFHRQVKNVGASNSTYRAEIFPKSSLDVQVVPAILSFASLNEVKPFDVVVKGRDLANDSMVSVSLVWSDGTHNVRSPIVIHNIN